MSVRIADDNLDLSAIAPTMYCAFTAPASDSPCLSLFVSKKHHAHHVQNRKIALYPSNENLI